MKRKRTQSMGSALLSTTHTNMVSICRKVSESGPSNTSIQQSISTISTTMQIIKRMVENGALEKGSDL